MESERLRELVGAAQRGDVDAFGRLAEEYRPRLRLVVQRMLGEADEAEDLVQETLLRAYVGLTQLREADRFGAWLVGIGLNLARMTLRRRVARERALARVAAGPVQYVETEALTLVRDVLEVLPRGERDAVVLYYIDGLACDEIAEVLGSSPGAVRVRLHRARARLRAQLAPLAPHEPTKREGEEPMIEMRLADVLVRLGDGEKVVADQRIVLLEEGDGGRVLPIWIGAAEGNALAVKLHSEPTFRPMTSDLLAQLVQLFGARVERVAVTRLHEKTFYASITLAVDGRTEELDARPSDALNLALRTAAPILVAADVLEEAAVGRDALDEKLEQEVSWADVELEPGEWRSLSAELVRELHRPPQSK